MIFTLCLTHFLAHGFHIVAVKGVDPRFAAQSLGPPGSEMAFVSQAVGSIFAGVDAHTAHVISSINYWIHVLIILFFLNYIPYSKHLHLLGALPNILLRNKEDKGVMRKLDLKTKAIGERDAMSSSAGNRCSIATLAPNVRAAATLAPRTPPASHFRRCISFTTSNTRCSSAASCWCAYRLLDATP
jgi:hypothetical protein